MAQLQAEQGVEKVNYLSREDALGEFRNWSGFGGALDMLEENPLPAVAVVIPKLDFQGTESLNTLRDRITQINGIDEVRMDDSWFARLAALTGLVGRVSAMIGVLMVAAVFLVIGNSVRLSIFARRDSINVQNDWCDGWFHPAPVPVRRRIAGIFWRIAVINFVRNSGTAFVIGGCRSGTGFRNEV